MMTDETRDSGEENGSSGRTAGTIRAYLDLTRLPNIFTAVADVTMGFLIARPPGEEWTPGWRDLGAWAMLAAASSLLYAAGVVLNDVFDLDHDRLNRPERPLPSGRVSTDAARRLGWGMLWAGVALGAGAGLFAGHLRPGVAAALLASAILLYDGWLKRTPLGPPAMGLCRTLNVTLGLGAAAVFPAPEFWLVAGAIGVYTAGVTWFARRETHGGGRLQLAPATAVIALGIVLLAWLPTGSDRFLRPAPQWYLLTGVVGLLIVWRCLFATLAPTPHNVRMAVTGCVISIIMLDALACYAFRGEYHWAVLIVLLMVPATTLGRYIEVT